jgi:1-acyl-sn-glycerol-3-phosphate acyltransferase
MFNGKPGSFLAVLNQRLTRTIVTGAEHLTALGKSGPAMIIINHTTVVDVIVTLGSLHKLGYTIDGWCENECTHKRHVRPIGTSDLWNFAFTRQMVEGSCVIPTDQFDGRSAYRAALQALKDGQCVLIYPEGDVKVNAQASPREWRPGAIGLARSQSMPIIPIAHHDSRKLGAGSVAKSIGLAFTRFIRRPKIHLTIGKPILPQELAGKTSIEVGQIMYEQLLQTWQIARAAN